ncbi:acyl-CoA thioesterase [Undibacterium fentianense]|uniref:Acyl-CoA thioesterase n=1 Tax=Undibacterium fentianense TaxID=2828728 RepID=A0A941E7D0_9BURK|nr:thioesterase family protein [Undibacterium fentianense]MBR7800048.1 acyl-CoA thioesterase [Undibacterium fentianense]
MSLVFRTPISIRFAHCDPAGIVFYPRYFELINGVVEDWCAQDLAMSFHEMHMVQGIGLPTVHIETDFVKTSVMGDELLAELRVIKLGRASATVEIRMLGQDQDLRLTARLVLVMAQVQERKAIALPSALREQMRKYLVS